MFDLSYSNDNDIMTESVLLEAMLFPTKGGKEKVAGNIQNIEKAISGGIKMTEDFIPLFKEYVSSIKKYYKATSDTDIAKSKEITKKFATDATALDYARGTDKELAEHSAAYVKLRMNKVFNMADYKSADMTTELATFIKKCSKNGEYANRVAEATKEYLKMYDDLNTVSDAGLAHYGIGDDGKAKAPSFVKDMMSNAFSEIKWFAKQLSLYDGDMKHVLDKHNKSKVEKFIKNSEKITEAVINYDLSDLTYAITECEADIANSISKFDKVKTALITENASESDLKVFTEAAGESIKVKLLKLLNAIKEFLLKRLVEITANLGIFTKANKEFVNTICNKVLQRLSAGEYKDGPSMNMHVYTLDKVSIVATKNLINFMLTPPGCDFKGYYNSISETVSDRIKSIQDSLTNYTAIDNPINRVKTAVYMESVGILSNNVWTLNINWDDDAISSLIYTKLHGDSNDKIDQTKNIKFNKDIIDTIRNSDSIEGRLVDIFNMNIKVINEAISSVGKLNAAEDGSLLSKYYNIKISILNAMVSTITQINMLKLKALTSEVNECKRFCMMAYHYKKDDK